MQEVISSCGRDRETSVLQAEDINRKSHHMLERSPDLTYFKALRQPVELVSLGGSFMVQKRLNKIKKEISFVRAHKIISRHPAAPVKPPKLNLTLT